MPVCERVCVEKTCEEIFFGAPTLAGALLLTKTRRGGAALADLQIVEIIVSRHGRRFLNLPAALQPRDHRPHRMGREDKEGRTEASPRKNKSKGGGEPKPRSHEENREHGQRSGNPAQHVRRGKQ